ncbi:MAG: hypothetical protein ACMUJM_24860 [bacterium]
MDSNKPGIYHPQKPEGAPLWTILTNHYEDFEKNYEKKFEKKYGFFRPVIKEVVEDYLKCGDLAEGVARVRCSDCAICTSCSKLQRKMVLPLMPHEKSVTIWRILE